jgi:hypothetical protein
MLDRPKLIEKLAALTALRERLLQSEAKLWSEVSEVLAEFERPEVSQPAVIKPTAASETNFSFHLASGS